MHTNTSRILTAFSDLPPEGDLVFLSASNILDYLHRYARMFDLDCRLRCDTRVEAVARTGRGWLVSHGGEQETFDKMVVATGRFHTPAVPHVPGLDTFSGSAGAITSYEYRGPSSYRGKRILVAGGFDTDRHTFHPDLPGLAFMGMWDQSGGYFVPLELQARWVAYTWGGAVEAASEADQRAAVAACRSLGPRKTRMNLAAVTFARAAGGEPRLESWPDLRRALLFGPLAPSCFRLEGPDALADAPARFAQEAAAFGAITDSELTDRELSYWSSVQDA